MDYATDPIPDEKYVVFKRGDFERWYEHVVEIRREAPILEPVWDAVVIRRQDIFAAPALDAYANSILVAATVLNSDESQKLQDIADYFHLQASRAWQAPNRKIPD